MITITFLIFEIPADAGDAVNVTVGPTVADALPPGKDAANPATRRSEVAATSQRAGREWKEFTASASPFRPNGNRSTRGTQKFTESGRPPGPARPPNGTSPCSAVRRGDD